MSRRVPACVIPLLLAGSAGLQGLTPQLPARDKPAPPQQIADLAGRITAEPENLDLYFQLARLQQEYGQMEEAEATLLRAKDTKPADPKVWLALATLYNKQGEFAKTIEMLQERAAREPGNPEAHQMLVTFYFEKAQKDASLPQTEKKKLVLAGLEAADRALALESDYVNALVYKNILLRMQANLEQDPAVQGALIAEADRLRGRALELQRGNPPGTTTGTSGSGLAGAPPPPPPPPEAPVRVGGSVKPPAKIRDVNPVYPEEARAARVQGVVILEIVVDTLGQVSSARVLRGIPLLENAAVDAVRQWLFEPTHLNGVPVPIIMTVTVNFTLQ
jgi:TonB family protein